MRTELMRRRWVRAVLLVGPAMLFYLITFVLPMLVMVGRSWRGDDGGGWTFANHLEVLGDPYYWRVLFRTLWVSLVVTAVSVVLGYVVSFTMVRAISSTVVRRLVLIAVLAPLFTASIVRAIGWIVILGPDGPLTRLLRLVAPGADGIAPFGYASTIIGLVQSVLPFAVLMILNNVQSLDASLEQASSDLGARPWSTFLRVTAPLSMPGVLAGALIAFALSVSAYAVPAVLGGGQLMVLPIVIYEQFMVTFDWGVGSALAVLLVVPTLALTVVMSRVVSRLNPEARA